MRQRTKPQKASDSETRSRSVAYHRRRHQNVELDFLLAFTRYIHYTPIMPTSHFYYVYILWDVSTHSHFYVGHTSDLAARLKTHNAGHVPHTSKYAPWEIHSAIAVQTEEQASEMEKYFKSHSGREWVIKHLGLPMGMKSLS